MESPCPRAATSGSHATWCAKVISRSPESAALCYGYSLGNRLQKPGGENSLQPECRYSTATVGGTGTTARQAQVRPWRARIEENKFQTEIGRDDGQYLYSPFRCSLCRGLVATFALKALSSVANCYDTYSQSDNQNSKCQRTQPAMTPWHVDWEECVGLTPTEYVQHLRIGKVANRLSFHR